MPLSQSNPVCLPLLFPFNNLFCFWGVVDVVLDGFFVGFSALVPFGFFLGFSLDGVCLKIQKHVLLWSALYVNLLYILKIVCGF